MLASIPVGNYLKNRDYASVAVSPRSRKPKLKATPLELKKLLHRSMDYYTYIIRNIIF